MSIFGKILSSIFGRAGAESASPSAPASAAPAPGGQPAPSTTAGTATQVDVADVLTKLAAEKKEKLDWRHSIVDLMKLLDLEAELAHSSHNSKSWETSPLSKQLTQRGKLPSESSYLESPILRFPSLTVCEASARRASRFLVKCVMPRLHLPPTALLGIFERKGVPGCMRGAGGDEVIPRQASTSPACEDSLSHPRLAGKRLAPLSDARRSYPRIVRRTPWQADCA